jgi:hypothetical protein
MVGWLGGSLARAAARDEAAPAANAVSPATAAAGAGDTGDIIGMTGGACCFVGAPASLRAGDAAAVAAGRAGAPLADSGAAASVCSIRWA